MTGQEWVAAFAELLDVAPPSKGTFDTLLELAGVAAHGSERIAAPIACYLVGQRGLGAAEALELARQVGTSR